MKRIALRGYCLALLLTGFNAAIPAAAQSSFSSGLQRVTLIELYTSEGCSSCPPADRWLSDLEDDPRLWRDFVPVAFHVDYWNYLGWRDRFARSEFSDRQRRHAAAGNARFVYTPGVFRNAREWRGWNRATVTESMRSATGVLRIEVQGARVIARFQPRGTPPIDPALHVVLLGMDLETDVLAGENRGEVLRHDFVALALQSTVMQPDNGGFDATIELPAGDVTGARRAIAAWVSAGDRLEPLQSTGGFLPFGPTSGTKPGRPKPTR